ncbi:hypothetical protein ES703_64058 [subsurface metagenome]
MIYSGEILLPKQPDQSLPTQKVLKVTKGLVYKVEVQFPPGCAGLAHVGIFDGAHPCWPSSSGETFNIDGATISFDDTYLKLAEPFQFEIWGWNEDTLWPHTIHVRIGLVSDEIFMARFLPTYSWDYYLRLLAETEAKQKEEGAAILEHPFPWVE